jgi:short/branched chain acyl-CoA dehydrogenase
MDFDLSDEQRLLRDTVRDFARQEVAPVAEELDRTKAFPYELVSKMGELGLMGIPFPEQYGGGGADTLAYALAVEELTRIDSSVAITMADLYWMGLLYLKIFGCFV